MGVDPQTAREDGTYWAILQDGKPYHIGSDGPDDFDCNGFVEGALKAGNVYPWPTRHAAHDYPNLHRIEWADRLPLDIVCFGDDMNGCHHVALVIDENLLMGANHGGPKHDGESEPDYVARMRAADDGHGARVCVVPSTYWASQRMCVVRSPVLEVPVKNGALS